MSTVIGGRAFHDSDNDGLRDKYDDQSAFSVMINSVSDVDIVPSSPKPPLPVNNENGN